MNMEIKKLLIEDDEASLKYTTALLDYPFKSYADVDKAFKGYVHPKNLSLLYKHVKIVSKEAIPLDAPFSIRSTSAVKDVVEKAASSKLSNGNNDFLEEPSSSGETTEEGYFHGDIKILNQDLYIKGKKIMENSSFTIVRGRIYGLVGRNGIGKSTLLRAIRKRRFGIDCGLKMHLVRQEACTENRTVLDYVVDGNYDNDDDLRMAKEILQGLGFAVNQKKEDDSVESLKSEIGVYSNVSDLSGGWAVRVSLARAVFVAPDLLLLDEPTNMLDIPSIVWLEKKIKQLDTTVIIVSHDREFLNNVCTDIFHLEDLSIETYKGNYDAFVTLRQINNNNQQKAYEKQKVDREHLQAFIDKFRYNAKRASLAQSKIKIMESMTLIKPVKPDPIIKFKFDFSDIRGVLLDLLNVSFGYPKKSNELNLENLSIAEKKSNKATERIILENVNIKITEKSRIVIVGPNGAGKSTFLKILSKRLEPTKGTIIINPNLKPGYFTQHHIDQLNLNESVLGFIMKKSGKKEEESRKALASFGLIADRQKIGTLSGGQKSRLAFATLSSSKPNILLLDEPTNHLDIESIDGLAKSLQEFKGAVICVSHDLKFVESVFTEVWICKDNALELFKGTIRDYRNILSGKKNN